MVVGALQQYADRGVFRGLTIERLRSGAMRLRFTWLTRRPIVLRLDTTASRLVFTDLLPHVHRRSPLRNDLADAILARVSRATPAHKRLDRRRATLEASFRGEAWSLVVLVRGTNQRYALRYALNLVNEIFLLLHECYPDYLVSEFGVSAE